MAKAEPRNEKPVCDAVINYLASIEGEKVEHIEQVDDVVRAMPAVEAIYRTKSKHFAVEHTRIESFLQQIGQGKTFEEFLAPLSQELSGTVAGTFYLIVAAGDIRVRRQDQEGVIKALKTWVEEKATTLAAAETSGDGGNVMIQERPPGVPFDVALRKERDVGSEVVCFQAMQADPQEARNDAMAASLEKKCPKLQAARNKLESEKKAGPVSVLVLESNDIALANRVGVANSVVAELAKRSDSPNIVVWARTSTVPWYGYIIKNGDTIHPNINRTMFTLSQGPE
jgi:hypothetical protein